MASDTSTDTGSSLLVRALAVVVLIVAAYILLKAVIGLVSALVWPVLAIMAIVAVIWAVSTLRQLRVFVGGAYVFIALCFGLAGGLIGRMKGSSFFIWFLVSALIPFIGLLCAILYRNERDEPRRLCPECGKACKVYEAKCLRCGYELEYPEPEEILPPESMSHA